MSLADMGIEMGELSVWRHIRAYSTACCAERHRGLLDLQAPLQVAQADHRSGVINLRSLLLECRHRLNGNEQAGKQTHGIFKIQKVSPLPADERHAATTAQLLLETDRYIRPLCFGVGEPRLPLDDNEIEFGNEPTLQIDFSSWMIFDISAKVPDGDIDLSICYPDYHNSGRRPIDEIDTFLTALLAEYRGARDVDPNFIDSGKMRHWAKDPALEMPEHNSSVTFQGWKYERIGGGYDFNRSWLQLTQRRGSDGIERCVQSVLQEFRRQIVKKVPSLCS